MIFSANAQFWLNGYETSKTRFWSENNPHESFEKSLQKSLSSVAYCMVALSDPFLQSEEGYIERWKLSNDNNGFSVALVGTNGFRWNIFRPEGATRHTCDETIDLLKEKYFQTLISLDVGDLGRIG